MVFFLSLPPPLVLPLDAASLLGYPHKVLLLNALDDAAVCCPSWVRRLLASSYFWVLVSGLPSCGG